MNAENLDVEICVIVWTLFSLSIPFLLVVQNTLNNYKNHNIIIRQSFAHFWTRFKTARWHSSVG